MSSHGPPAPSNGSATGDYTPAVAQTPPFDNARFVLNTIIFILAGFALFAVASWPRLLTRFSRGSEWARGHLVYHSTKPQRRLPVIKRRPTNPRNEKRRAPNSDDDHTTFSHIGLVRREGTHDVKFSLPPHCRSWSGIYQRSSAILGIQLFEDCSLGRCVILLCYSAIIIFASLYKSNPFLEYVRTGWVSTAQIPIVFALATKSNVIGRFLSMGYEKVRPSSFSAFRAPRLILVSHLLQLNFLHRFAGTLAILAANVHALGYGISFPSVDPRDCD